MELTSDGGAALDRYWDALVSGRSAPSDPGLNRRRAATVRRLHLDRGTAPMRDVILSEVEGSLFVGVLPEPSQHRIDDARRADHLWHDLMIAVSTPVSVTIRPNRREPALPSRSRLTRAMSLVSAATLIIAVLGSIVIYSRHPEETHTRASLPASMALAAPASCPVTQPNGLQPPARGNAFGAGHGDYGNASLWTSLWIWGEGVVAVPADHVNAKGEAEDLKWPWYRFVRGAFNITGHRLDGEAPPLRSSTSNGYGDQGFDATGITFPTPGCWEVTGHLDAATLTFVVWVVYLDEGTPYPTYPPATPVDGCLETQPNDVQIPGQPTSPGGYGNSALWTNLSMWSHEPGKVMVDSQHMATDGGTSDLKWAWWRFATGTFSISGWRLDDPSAEPLRATISDGYGDSGLDVVGLIFPSAGCWEVIGSIGGQELPFILEVHFPDTATPVSKASPIAFNADVTTTS